MGMFGDDFGIRRVGTAIPSIGGGGGDGHPGSEVSGDWRPGYWKERFQADGVSGTLDNEVLNEAPSDMTSVTGGPWAFV